MTVLAKHTQTSKEYLEWEAAQEFKHEFYAGELFAQAGASSTHVSIALNIGTLLHTHLKGKPCRTYISDMKLRVEEVDAYFYPDLMVTCDARDRETNMYKQYPSIITEVLSDSTAEYDRTFKFACYRTIPTLRDYLLVSQDVFLVEHYHRNEQNEWVRHDYTKDSVFTLSSIDLSLSVSDIYADCEGVLLPEVKFRRVE